MTRKTQERLIREIQNAGEETWREREGEEFDDDEYDGEEFLIAAGNELCYNGSPADMCLLIGMVMFDVAKTRNIPLGVIVKTSEAWADRLAGTKAEADAGADI